MSILVRSGSLDVVFHTIASASALVRGIIISRNIAQDVAVLSRYCEGNVIYELVGDAAFPPHY